MHVFLIIVALVALFGAGGFFAARARALALARQGSTRLNSRPVHHASFVAIVTVVPAALVMAVWMIASPLLIGAEIRKDFPESVRLEPVSQQSLTFNTVTSVAYGLRQLSPEARAQVSADTDQLRQVLARNGIPLAANPPAFVLQSAERMNALSAKSSYAMAAIVLAVSLVSLALAYRAVRPAFKARNSVERVVLATLLIASSIAIITTVGIVLSMLSETLRFFSQVSPIDFFFGTVWDPRFAAAGEAGSAGQFGLIPLLAGTIYISLVAMAVAVPIGLYAAIYMSEYASSRLRAIAKPLLEVLAGIPTIVYGFFALVTVGPLLRDLSAELNNLLTGNYRNFIEAQSVLTAGIVMGIMLIPFVSSLSDDIINAVPDSLRKGSLGLGATQSETIKRVVMPAALPGIVGALLLTASRAIGETMIVVLAAGVAANLQLNPFEPMTTVTVKIVNQLTGDLEFNTPQTLVAFALGLTLFVITLCLNVYALYVVRKYREQYQ
ncbi:phosphate ABC transporter permease subunit PstC [Martelella endophytica]|uniref:Phosphate transport system permease protein n=1 Tax=Martelella endophytica TaxID=1486262 RepID=A0A0D5LN03_MAREN|nr:phosphate ABC transporter permease subunit PstC [Martelella endophytica]AJY45335.1 ABC transporter permease [Martelella endophytica]